MMEEISSARKPVRSLVTKYCNEIMEMVKENCPDRDLLRSKREGLEEYRQQLVDLDKEMLQTMISSRENEDRINKEFETVAAYGDKYRIAKIKADAVLNNISTLNISVDSESTIGTHKSYRLPKYKLEEYDGSLKKWMGFWSQFEKIHLDEQLHDADKAQYLIQAMVPGSSPHHLISSYPRTADNYKNMVEALKTRFGNKILLTEYYIRQLLRMVIHKSTGQSKSANLTYLYDELESHLRTLETLGITKEQSAVFLYPLVESCLPNHLIDIWQRGLTEDVDEQDPQMAISERLKNLMKFLQKEANAGVRRNMVKEGFTDKREREGTLEDRTRWVKNRPHTATSLIVKQENNCIFCEREHETRKCPNAGNFSYDTKVGKLRKVGACFSCTRTGHNKRDCMAKVRCTKCGRNHVDILCTRRDQDPEVHTTEVVSQLNCTKDVLLQTVYGTIRVGDKSKKVRILLDSGSQKSYVLDEVMKGMKRAYKGETHLCHSLFGGRKETKNHKVYDISLTDHRNKYSITMEVLGQNQICGRVPGMDRGEWLTELKKRGIFVEDIGSGKENVEMLIGSDYYGKLLCGRIEVIHNGLVAIQTRLGWCLSGKLDTEENDTTLAMTVTSMHLDEQRVADLWNLETIGIMDPAIEQSKKSRELRVREDFLKTVTQDIEGRYVVELPWVSKGTFPPDNKDNAVRRLKGTTLKLRASGNFDVYNQVFVKWLKEGLIEKGTDERAKGHYLPHRAVFKPNSRTTPVRPVFDASCRTGRAPSLNECLERGENLMELLPALMVRFRENLVGVTADIRKAFQMIEVAEADRDYLRFLWWDGEKMDKLQVYRHTRVVFGVNCSPFLLAAVIKHHLDKSKHELSERLWRSFYVDNCVMSVDSLEEYRNFKRFATKVMSDAGMELRQWCHTKMSSTETITAVLGLKWDTCEDTLSCEIPDFPASEVINKRAILSFLSKIFDPLGFLSPTTLLPKLLLQETWTSKLNWEQAVPLDVSKRFKDWGNEITLLRYLKIPRHMRNGTQGQIRSSQLHAFSDASQEAYAAVVFLRTEYEDDRVELQLLMAKSRVAPLKRPTIPRLELLGCLIAARLMHAVKGYLEVKDYSTHYWTDSMTALAWIKRNNAWGTFVGNRVKEICAVSEADSWRHIPGEHNPADLPSRGCGAGALLDSKWWEGPGWLARPSESWPTCQVNANEVEILAEAKSLQYNCLVNTTRSNPWYLPMATYQKNVRMIAWIRKWAKKPLEHQNGMGVTTEEYTTAEMMMLKMMQEEQFGRKTADIKGLTTYVDKDGLLRIRTRLLDGAEMEYSNYPILLSPEHPMVTLLIKGYHKEYRHAGTQFLMAKIRERFWLPKCRRTVQKVTKECHVCLRFSSKNFSSKPATLPLKRVVAKNAFQTVGIDLAGPLYLKNGKKVWITLFTCAVYRCIHLDLVNSLNTEAFLEALERFVNTRGRPTTIYSDNGTNFTAAAKLFQRMNWDLIENRTQVKQIKWVFNPPTAAWWGGWWERLVRSIKDLLKRMLGQARVTYDQLRTNLSHAERIINDRPLTAVTEDHGDLIALTPGMFMLGNIPGTFPEAEDKEVTQLHQELKRRKTLKDELLGRFKREYLSLLIQKAKERSSPQPQEGDVVLIGSDVQKRTNWPIGRINKVFISPDGEIRVAQVTTAKGVLVRPVQRLYLLEASTEESDIDKPKLEQPIEESELQGDSLWKSKLGAVKKGPTCTRSGRQLKTPVRYKDYHMDQIHEEKVGEC